MILGPVLWTQLWGFLSEQPKENLNPLPSAPRSHVLCLPLSPQDPRQALLASLLLQQKQPHIPGNGPLNADKVA